MVSPKVLEQPAQCEGLPILLLQRRKIMLKYIRILFVTPQPKGGCATRASQAREVAGEGACGPEVVLAPGLRLGLCILGLRPSACPWVDWVTLGGNGCT
jgi:hypothetical protein